MLSRLFLYTFPLKIIFLGRLLLFPPSNQEKVFFGIPQKKGSPSLKCLLPTPMGPEAPGKRLFRKRLLFAQPLPAAARKYAEAPDGKPPVPRNRGRQKRRRNQSSAAPPVKKHFLEQKDVTLTKPGPMSDSDSRLCVHRDTETGTIDLADTEIPQHIQGNWISPARRELLKRTGDRRKTGFSGPRSSFNFRGAAFGIRRFLFIQRTFPSL